MNASLINSASESLSNISNIVLAAFFVISTTILPILIYIVLTKSTKEMGSFRIFLSCEIFWSYIFGLYLSLIQPEMYFPHIMGRITGPINILCSKSGCNIAIELLFLVAAGYGQSLFCIVLFRLWRLSPLSITFIFDNQLRIMVLAFAILLPTVVFVVPVLLARVEAGKGLRYLMEDFRELESQLPFRSQLVIYNNPENNDFWIKYIVILISTTMALIIFGSILLLSLITYLTFKNKASMSPPRFKMSLMLLKTTVIQVFLGIAFLILPLCVVVAAVMFQSPYANSIAFVMVMITSFHSSTEFIFILIFVKQYRNFIIKKFLSIISKFIGREENYRNRLPSISDRIGNHLRRNQRTSSVSSVQAIVNA